MRRYEGGGILWVLLLVGLVSITDHLEKNLLFIAECRGTLLCILSSTGTADDPRCNGTLNVGVVEAWRLDRVHAEWLVADACKRGVEEGGIRVLADKGATTLGA